MQAVEDMGIEPIGARTAKTLAGPSSPARSADCSCYQHENAADAPLN
jgi:hypothetical protein